MTPAAHPTHNPHLDAARAVVAATPHPTPVDAHELNLALIAARNASWNLAEVRRLIDADNVLRVQAETAFLALRRLGESIRAREEQGRAH